MMCYIYTHFASFKILKLLLCHANIILIFKRQSEQQFLELENSEIDKSSTKKIKRREEILNHCCC